MRCYTTGLIKLELSQFINASLNTMGCRGISGGALASILLLLSCYLLSCCYCGCDCLQLMLLMLMLVMMFINRTFPCVMWLETVPHLLPHASCRICSIMESSRIITLALTSFIYLLSLA